jgi:predicted acylesterase/phospholipase RssA
MTRSRPHASSSPNARTAVVMSGGGAKGAYALGTLRAITTGACAATKGPVEPAIFTGTSVGAFNATLLAEQCGVSCSVALDRVERIWRTRVADDDEKHGNGVFRIRGLPEDLELGALVPTPSRVAQLVEDSVTLGGEMVATMNRILSSEERLGSRFASAIDGTAFVDTAPLHKLLTDNVDFDALARSDKDLGVVASDWAEGTPRVFGRAEIATRRDLLPLLASMAIPGLFPPVLIDGVAYVDGGLSMNTPVKPAIDAGADVVHMIFLDPALAASRPASFGTVDVISRIFAALASEQVKNDLKNAQAINHGLGVLEAADRGLPLLRGHSHSKALSAVASAAAQHVQGRRQRRVEIHVYRPAGGLAHGADMLDFHIDHIDALIKRGYDDAVRHDCKASSCSLLEA